MNIATRGKICRSSRRCLAHRNVHINDEEVAMVGGAGSRGGTSKSTFYRAWREGQVRRFGIGSITVHTHTASPGQIPRRYDYDAPPVSAFTEARKAAGLSLSELGQKIGTAGSHIVDMENGTWRPNASQAEALDVILGMAWRRREPVSDPPKAVGLHIARRKILRLVKAYASGSFQSSAGDSRL